jgi:pimeloyl-ACP methyl ester carboxylesterase
VLLVHGWSGDPPWPGVQALAGAGLRGVAPTLPGWGDSDKPPDGMAPRALGAWLATFARATGPYRAVLAAGSAAGWVGPAADVVGLLVYPSGPRWGPRAPIPPAFARSVVGCVAPIVRPRLRAAVVAKGARATLAAAVTGPLAPPPRTASVVTASVEARRSPDRLVRWLTGLRDFHRDPVRW